MPLGRPKAMAMLQAAVTIDTSNFMAANELGVLFARYGQWEQARRLLQQSVAALPLPETWAESGGRARAAG